MLSWSIQELTLPLKYSWKISRNESSFKTNFIVSVTDGITTGSGEIAPNIRYGETPVLIKEEFARITSDLQPITTLNKLVQFFDKQGLLYSLRFGIESAFVHYQARKNQAPVYTQLGLPAPTPVYTSYTLPIMDIGKVKDFITEHNLLRFRYLKIKINQETGEDLIREVTKISTLPLRIDANEAWQDVDNLIVFMEKWKKHNIQFFEQPLPAAMEHEYHYLKTRSPFELIADESVTHDVDMDRIATQFHGVNMKLMKAGGYLAGIKILKDARERGLKTMIGCMVETSLGIFSAINLCNDLNYIDLDGHFLIENEPFNIVSEREGRLFT